METGIKILYNGKKFETIDKARASDEDILVTVGMALDVEAVLEPLRPEIEKEGGHVSIDVKGPSMFQIYTENLSENLKQRVIKALTPPNKKQKVSP